MVRVLTVLFLLSLSSPARSDQSLLPKCQSALSACDLLVKAQATEIDVLNDSIKQWKKQAEAAAPSSPIVLVSAVSGAAGGLLTGEVAGVKNALLVGTLMGGLMGLTVGLLINTLGR